MKPEVCDCIPDGHRIKPDATRKQLRRVRRDCLANARRWAPDPMAAPAIKCTLYTAHLCLLRLRELKSKGDHHQ